MNRNRSILSIIFLLALSTVVTVFLIPQKQIAKADQCDNSAAQSEYNGCKSSASQEKSSCIQDCNFYKEDPCYGECESNYNQCTAICNDTYGSAMSTCSDIFADNSVFCSNEDKSGDAEPKQEIDTPKEPQPKNCNTQENNLNTAKKKVQDACKGIDYPERLLTDKGREPNDMLKPLCETLKENVKRDQSTLDRAQKLLDWDKSEKSFFEKTVIPNIKAGQSQLWEEYEELQKDIDEKKEILDEVSERFSEIKDEADHAWIEAVAGTGGPAGAFVDIGLSWWKAFSGKNSTHIGVRTGIDVAEYGIDYWLEKVFETELNGIGLNKFPKGTKSMGEFSPLAFVGIAYDGLELQELKHKTAEAEREYKQKLGWYQDAVTAMNGFKSREGYSKLMNTEKKLEEVRQKIKLLDIEINSLEKQIPVMKHTLGISKELSDKCEKDLKEDNDLISQQERCRQALKDEQTAKTNLSACEASK